MNFDVNLILLLAGVLLLLLTFGMLRANRRARDIQVAMADYEGARLPDTWQRGVERAEAAAGRMSIFERLRWNYAWAQRNGEYKGRSLGALIVQMGFYGLIGLLLPLVIHPAPASWFVPLLLSAYPTATLQRKGDEGRKRAKRAMPEVATLVAAELSAGSSPEQAITRAARLPSPLSLLIQDAIDKTQQSGYPLFSRGNTPGVLREVFTAAQLPALRAFATQLDLVAAKGVEGAHLMSEIARSLAREHREQVLEDTEQLDGKLTVAVSIFFFIPMFVLIVGSFFSTVLTAM
ncbi:MAG: hypothetical protein HN413_13290 [Chloroflexi bacterium]|jgi:Flp pilus assembly protein TadB|nr:hypothetical protein [Chloroflexota bacterium]